MYECPHSTQMVNFVIVEIDQKIDMDCWKSNFNDLKRFLLPYRRGVTRHDLVLYVKEYQWRRNVGAVDHYEEFMKCWGEYETDRRSGVLDDDLLDQITTWDHEKHYGSGGNGVDDYDSEERPHGFWASNEHPDFTFYIN